SEGDSNRTTGLPVKRDGAFSRPPWSTCGPSRSASENQATPSREGPRVRIPLAPPARIKRHPRERDREFESLSLRQRESSDTLARGTESSNPSRSASENQATPSREGPRVRIPLAPPARIKRHPRERDR